MPFPNDRPRRLRSSTQLRDLVAETKLVSDQLVYPLFIKEDIKQKEPIASMPGIFQLSVAEAVKEAKESYKKGIKTILLFGIPSKKDTQAHGAYDKNGIVQKAVREIKNSVPHLQIVTDVCLCEYMSHGHCGLITKKNEIDNDATLELLAKTALSHTNAGADIIAPSDMMDGRVRAIRQALDSGGYLNTPIMSYAVKYASSFYGPFRDAAESAPKFGDRKTYQMDFRNSREALIEAALDIEEGADILMVKPAMPSLDIIKMLSERITQPLAAYQVSGEFSMIEAAAKQGWMDRKAAILESLTVIKRAGAGIIITYFAKEVVEYLE